MNTSFLEHYRFAAHPLPPTYRRWHLYGAGMENVGGEGSAPESVPTPSPAPDQVLVRHDACGICFSDIKIINLGQDHPRLAGRDLQKEPVVMGHEVALTMVQVGENYRDRFQPGQRFIIQADILYQGKGVAYGYALPGGMSEYGLIGAEVLEGDEGCYLLPIHDNTTYADAALVEPWACVEAAYHWSHRDGYQPGGKLLRVYTSSDTATTVIPHPNTTIWDGASKLPDSVRYNDIEFMNPPTAHVFETACVRLAKNGIVHLRFDSPMGQPVPVDIGRIHYDGHFYVGTKPNHRSELKAGGIAWFVGAAGPMGQMHVQRALQLPTPPKKLICTDQNPNRIAALRKRYLSLAESRGVELRSFDVKNDPLPDLTTLAPDGFDDIVVMVPDAQTIEAAFPHLGRDGVLNIFAGVARGTMATLDVSTIATKNVRIVGTSGSTIEDMRRTRDAMEAHRLDTGASLAAVGGLDAFKEGLKAVKEGTFPGKIVIFPHIKMPLTSLEDLQATRPTVYAKLRDGQFWTAEAEAELLRGEVQESGDPWNQDQSHA